MRFILIIISILVLGVSGKGQILINEVVYDNRTGLEDSDSDTPDWLELYNAGDNTVNLKNWGLSDNSNNPFKWRFPSYDMHAGEYLLVFASGKDHKESSFHANFKLKPMEEPLLLTYPNGLLVDSLPVQCVPVNHSVGRIPDGEGEWQILNNTSPGLSNNNAKEVILNYRRDTLKINREGGFYNQSVSVELSHDVPGNIVYFTQDGSVPDDRSESYSMPLKLADRTLEDNIYSTIESSYGYLKPDKKVFKGTPLQAIIYSEGCPASEPVKETFFIGANLAERFPVPVVSIIVDPDDFFSEEEGIYVQGKHTNYSQSGSDWEREIHLEIYDEERSKIIDQNAGARIHGRGTRYSAQKSLRLYASEKYGNSSFDYPFFSNRDQSSYKRLILRTTRGDWSDIMFTDLLSHQLAENLNIETMAGITTVVFINGEYWGIQNLRERQDEHYLGAHHPETSGDEYDIINYVRGGVAEPKEGDMNAYEELLDILSDNSLSDADQYESVSQKVDMGSMIDYYIAELYFGNVDFPDINQRLWRSKNENGKWRWLFFDCDACFFRFNYDHFSDYYEQVDGFERFPSWSLNLLTMMLQNTKFSNEFYQRFYYSINTYFSPDQVITKIDSLMRVYQPLMNDHIDRWNDPGDIDRWFYNIERKKEVAIGRPAEVTNQILKYYGSPVKIGPNPASDVIWLESELFSSEELNLQIYDLSGRLLHQDSQQSGNSRIEMRLPDHMRDGIYLVQARVGYMLDTQKIIVHHD